MSVHNMHLLQYTYLILLSLPLIPLCHTSIARPGCQAQCGTLPIPYPFGVGPSCSMGPSFDITCNNNTKPYLTVFPRKLSVIDITETRLRVEYPYLLTGSCHNTTPGPTEENWGEVTTFGTQYTLSDENWLTTIGCDDLVRAIGADNQTYSGGCVTYCSDPGAGSGFCPDNSNGFSTGNGCCRAPIPTGLTFLAAYLTTLNETWRTRNLFRCSYTFIQEKGVANQSQFSYPLSYLNNPMEFISYDDVGPGWKTRFPLVMRLDWRIGDENCSQARQSPTSFACQENSVCVDFGASVGGYHCHCLQGYQGNPYLPGGCQDINECNDNRTNPCDSNAICTNTPGQVVCTCPKGYDGDGRKDGTRCVRMNHTTLVLILTGLGSWFVLIVLLAVFICLDKALRRRKKRMRKEKFFRRNGGLLLQQQANEDTVGKTKLFSAEELETATDNFKESRILGKGGQGTVYKGMLPDGKIVAIKKSKVVDDNLVEQFINEVVILSQINHRNVVKLLGTCLDTDVPLLVYEFLPNGTLYDLIHDPSDTRTLLTWSMRLKIAADIAGALAYIHSASSVPIYHRDIKSQNFLLDKKYVVKLADFGISRSIEVNQTHLTTMVRGTFGYLDPEYFHSRQYSDKSEVYSFGVVLAELLTSKKPIYWESEERMSLATRFVDCAEENRVEEILDPRFLENGKNEEVSAVARVAQRCLHCKGKMRPTMKEVATELESLWISQMPSPSAIVEQSEEARSSMIISDMDETWTTWTAPMDTHTFMIEELVSP